MLDGSGGDEILPGTVVSTSPYIAMAVGKIVANDDTSFLTLGSQAASAAILYDSHPTAVSAPAAAAAHAEATNPVQLMQAQIAAAYSAHGAPVDMHGDWSLIAGDAHHAADAATHGVGQVFTDPLTGVGYTDTMFHPFFDHVDMFGFADHFHFGSDFDLFSNHNLTVDAYF